MTAVGHVASMVTTLAAHSSGFDRVDARLDRIEKQLELHDAPA